MPYRVSFQTFGCKLNQLETESLADAFGRGGASLIPLGSGAELHILNTCTVTGKAEQKARRAIRSALSANPGTVVIVTGCYAQVEAAALKELDPRVVVVSGDDKSVLHGLAAYLGEEWQGHGDLLEAVREWRLAASAHGSGAGSASDRFAFSPESFAFHSRPSLKIQDGCDNHCSYCRVCIARGHSVSLEPERVLERLRGLEEAGAAEAVLTGINLSQYRSGGLDLSGLLAFLLARSSRIALRLGSIEPDRVDGAFLEVFAEPRIRPHLHLPVQSGSDAVLARMGRRYKAKAVLAACEAARKAKDDPFIAADLITGFPGEGEEDYAATLGLAGAAGFAWIHAFPFSARPGTAAWAMKPKVAERVAGERVAGLTRLAEAGRAAYVGRWLGREVEAVLEGGSEEAEDREGAEGGEESPAKPPVLGLRRAMSANYLRLGLDDPALGGGGPEGAGFHRGQALRCRINSATALPGLDALGRCTP
jgi:threonylcarbamoyladenosine tRNA methylthiotransferase MtaB